MWDM